LGDVSALRVRAELDERGTTLVAAIARGRRWLDEIVAGTGNNVELILRGTNMVRRVNMTVSLASSRPNSSRQPSTDDCLAASASLAYATLLPSGLDNTRCSACRFESGRSSRPLTCNSGSVASRSA
jgi:hypothetical protein